MTPTTQLTNQTARLAILNRICIVSITATLILVVALLLG